MQEKIAQIKGIWSILAMSYTTEALDWIWWSIMKRQWSTSSFDVLWESHCSCAKWNGFSIVSYKLNFHHDFLKLFLEIGVSPVVSTWALKKKKFHFLLIFRVILVKNNKKECLQSVWRNPLQIQGISLKYPGVL